MTKCGFLLAVTTIAAAASSSAATLCASPNGAVKARATCKKKETQVPDLATLAQVVKDSQGKLVGSVVDVDAQGWVDVVRELAGQKVEMVVSAQGFQSPSSWGVYYATTDCSGSPFLDVLPGALVVHAPILAGRAYYPFNVSTQGPTMRSFESGVPPGVTCNNLTVRGGCCTGAVGFAVFSAPASTIDLDTLGLVPPFHVEGP
jgi:hypothetical protein